MLTIEHGFLSNWFVLNRQAGGADVEGDRDEWAAIAEGLETGRTRYFKRCCVSTMPGGAYALHSPRNSMSSLEVNAVQAAELAREIRHVLAETPVDVAEEEEPRVDPALTAQQRVGEEKE